MAGKIIVLVKEPGKDARLERIEPTLETFQKIVDGHLEAVWVKENVYMYIDEEGKLKYKEPNFPWKHGDTIVGSAVFFGRGEDGEEISLTPDQLVSINFELELRKLIRTPFCQVIII